MPIPAKTLLATRKATLLARKAAIVARLAAIETELAGHQTNDWDDLALEREGDEVLEAAGLTGQHDLRRIEAALNRIDRGEYGVCVRCGAKIEEARLDALPETPFCRACATSGEP
ncbi:MAG: TraR/DksA C4-type zinc finger protein [Pseudomonadota bacterium]